MDQASLESILADLHLPAIRYFTTIDSTNIEAWRWIEAGAPHAALVVADEQTAGRGRLQRRWITVPGGGLAFSLVLSFPLIEPDYFSRLTGLGALAVCLALQKHYALPAKIKWPNDILLGERKTGGVLAEASWSGERINAVVIGIGINIAMNSIDPDNMPPEILNFPVTCVEEVLGHPVKRMDLLHGILEEFFNWLPKLASNEFLKAWEDILAYRGQWVEVMQGTHDPSSSPVDPFQQNRLIGKEIGLAPDGALQVLAENGEVITVRVGEIHLRPTTIPSQG